MALPAADDGFERHYTEKLWALVPEVYRNEDGLAEVPGQLRALIEIVAAEAAVGRRSVDRLWADTRVDEADDWAIPYIGGLLGTRAVSVLNRAAQRANVQRTIFYRRRAGTVRLLEILADDIADGDALASEAFRRLLRNWHLIDSGPRPGPITGTPQWGLADLRNVRIGSIVDTAHDDVAHHPDFRRRRGWLGRYSIPKVNLHLFRQYAYRLSGVTPFPIADRLFTLDPSGRDVPLFQVGGRALTDCVAAAEWEVRAPIPCRRLNAASFRPLPEHAPAGLVQELAPIYGRRFTEEAALLEAAEAALATDPVPPNALADHEAAHLIAATMEARTPRRNLLPGGDPAALSIAIAVAANFTDPPLGPEHLYGANLEEWGQDHAPPGWVEALVDPALGRLRMMDPIPADRDVHMQRIFYGRFWPIGAGTHDRGSLATTGFTPLAVDSPDLTAPLAGELRFMDSRTFTPQIPANGVILASGDLTLSAANGERPYVVLTPQNGSTVTIRSNDPDAELVIDGLWIGVFPAAGTGDTRLRIDGRWRKVTLRNVTIDPGGERAAAPGSPPESIPAVELAFGGAIDDVDIASAITGRIDEETGALDPCATDTIRISDSIVRSDGVLPAIRLRNAELCLHNCTVLGAVVGGRLTASQVLVDGLVEIEDQQSGCFRFSAAVAGSRVPRPYESHFFADRLPAGTFVSRRFGDPGYVQLSEIADANLREGGENGTEIGAHNRALDPIKRADLQAKLAEFLPINAIAELVFET